MNALDSRSDSAGPARGKITLVLVLLALLAGCATQTAGPAPASPALLTEQHWLEDWFRGTPVLVKMHDSQTLTVDVPLGHCFAPGRSEVKPALAAVLDRLATSLRRQATLRLTITAPTDSDGPATLAAGRTQQVREQLLARGVASTRATGLGTGRAGTALQLRLVAVAPLIQQLDDATLPRTGAGAKRTGTAPAATGTR